MECICSCTVLLLLSLAIPFSSANYNQVDDPMPVDLGSVIAAAGSKFSTFASLVKATGLDTQLQQYINAMDTGRLTIFAPSDAAFAALPAGALDKLTLEQKVAILKIHAVPAYYPQSVISKVNDPFVATFATAASGPGKFLLSISSCSGAVTISTGVVSLKPSGTLFDKQPVVVYSIEKVLLPKEIFGPK